MPDISRRAKAGEFGTEIIHVTGMLETVSGTITANTTVKASFGAVHRKGYINKLVVHTITVPVDADGTILATVKKYDASAAADVTLATSYNLEGLAAKVASVIPFDAGVTQAQRTLDEGDMLFVDVTDNSAGIDTQCVGLRFGADIAVLQ